MIFLLVFVGFLTHGEASNMNSSTSQPKTDSGCDTDEDCPALQPVCGAGENPGICGCRVSQDCPPNHVCNQSNNKCTSREELVMVQPVKINIKKQDNIITSKKLVILESKRNPLKGLCCKYLSVGGAYYIRQKKYKKAFNGCLSRCIYIEIGDSSFTSVCFKPGNLLPQCHGNMEMPLLLKNKKNIPGKKKIMKKRSRNSLSFGSHNWMSKVKDNVRLNELTIPGTHDTMAYKGDCPGYCEWALTQGTSLWQQLHDGARFIDIRLKIKNGILGLYHGPVDLQSYFQEVLMYVFIFLEFNPTETIIMRYDNEGDDSADEFCNTFKIFADYYLPWIWVPTKNREPSKFYEIYEMPMIRETRGKFILKPTTKDTNGAGCKETGIEVHESKTIELDNYEGNTGVDIEKWEWWFGRRSRRSNMKKTETKKKEFRGKHIFGKNFTQFRSSKNITNFLFDMKNETQSKRKVGTRFIGGHYVLNPAYKTEVENFLGYTVGTNPDKLMVTYVSATCPPWLTPDYIAAHMNIFVGDYFSRNHIGRFGIVVFDFFTSIFKPDLPALVYTTNFDSVIWTGKWGYWASHPTFCPDGSFVYGFRLRIESKQGDGDDSALNNIELYCRKPGSSTVTQKIWSSYMSWGYWYAPSWCSSTDNPVVAFLTREESQQGSGDDSALNSIAVGCRNGQWLFNDGLGYWGDWTPVQSCSPGKAVNGIQTQVESDQGDGDDTALNGVRLFCSDYP